MAWLQCMYPVIHVLAIDKALAAAPDLLSLSPPG